MKSSVFGAKADLTFMHHALTYAQQAYDQNEVPIGAIVVDAHGTIIGAGINQVEKLHTQRAHAESIAIEQAGHAQHDWRLDGCWLYVTLEPCLMCMGLIRFSRMQGIIFATSSPLFGYRLDNDTTLSVYNRDLLVVVEGVDQERASALLQQFFQKKRKTGG